MDPVMKKAFLWGLGSSVATAVLLLGAKVVRLKRVADIMQGGGIEAQTLIEQRAGQLQDMLATYAEQRGQVIAENAAKDYLARVYGITDARIDRVSMLAEYGERVTDALPDFGGGDSRAMDTARMWAEQILDYQDYIPGGDKAWGTPGGNGGPK